MRVNFLELGQYFNVIENKIIFSTSLIYNSDCGHWYSLFILRYSVNQKHHNTLMMEAYTIQISIQN